jgi:hypothetical protein
MGREVVWMLLKADPPRGLHRLALRRGPGALSGDAEGRRAWLIVCASSGRLWSGPALMVLGGFGYASARGGCRHGFESAP